MLCYHESRLREGKVGIYAGNALHDGRSAAIELQPSCVTYVPNGQRFESTDFAVTCIGLPADRGFFHVCSLRVFRAIIPNR